MDTPKRLYVDFEPSCQIVQGKEEDTILLVVPGFSNEQLRVEVSADGNLQARGERPLDGVRWSRFTKDFRLPLTNYDASSIQAGFEDDTLYVTLPKVIRPAPQNLSAPPTLPLPKVEPPPERKKQAEEEDKQQQQQQQQQQQRAMRTRKERMQEKEREGALTNGLETPRRRTLLLNVAVAVAVLFAMGIYMIFKLPNPASSNQRSK